MIAKFCDKLGIEKSTFYTQVAPQSHQKVYNKVLNDSASGDLLEDSACSQIKEKSIDTRKAALMAYTNLD